MSTRSASSASRDYKQIRERVGARRWQRGGETKRESGVVSGGGGKGAVPRFDNKWDTPELQIQDH